jgi:outer membrane biosynthesis protein TonB
MRVTPAHRRWLLALASLVAALLACARAQVTFVPITPQVATPLPVAFQASTPGATSLPPATPTESAPAATAYPGPPTQPVEEPSATQVVQLPPTDTLVIQPTALPTDTPTLEPPTPTPAPTETSAPAPTQATGPQPIPPDAQFIQTFTASAESGTVLGRPQDMADGRNETWASLRPSDGIWNLDLGTVQNVVGVRLYAQRDGADPTTLIQIDVSTDGQTWTTVFTGSGDCGVPNCDTLPKLEFTDIGWTPTRAQFIRLHSGPYRFALGEIQVAVVP